MTVPSEMSQDAGRWNDRQTSAVVVNGFGSLKRVALANALTGFRESEIMTATVRTPR